MVKKKICIIGSGLTGTLLAAELLESGKYSVLLIDKDSPYEKFQIREDLYNYYPFDLFPDYLTFSFGFGGSSNLWHGVMTNFDEIDYERLKNNYGLKELCNSRMTNLSYKLFPQIDTVLFKNSFSKENQLLKKKVYYVPRKPCRMREIIKYLKKKFSNDLIIYENSIAIDFNININQNIFKVESLNIIRENKKELIKSDIFISSLGALETPRLLKQSFDKFKINSTNIGLNLLDHPYACIGKLKFKRKVTSKNGHPGLFSKYKEREGLSPTKLINNRNFSLNLIPNISSLKDSVKNLSTKDKKKFFKLSAASVPFTTKLFFNYVRTESYNLIYHHEILKSDNGKLLLTQNIDAFGRRKFEFHYPAFSSFYKTINLIKSKNLLDNIFHDIENIEIFSKEKITEIFPASHYAGTCFASAYHKESICNEDFKVKDFDNLFISDASVLPIIGNSNLSTNLSKIAKIVSTKISQKT